MAKKKINIIDEVETTENVVPTPEIKIEKPTEHNSNVELEILVSFTDKYNNEHYKVGDVINVDKVRANELLSDSRKLVIKK